MNKFRWEKHQYHLQDEMIEWCHKNIGSGGWYGYIKSPEQLRETDQWGCWWTLGSGGFVFRTRDQLELFTNVWSTR